MDIQSETHEAGSDEIKGILSDSPKIAIVGLSPKEERDSNKVAKYLIKHGFQIIPVNPGQDEILGQKCYKSLDEIPFKFDIANLFLNPVRVPPIVDQAIKLGIKTVWMQLGVINNEAAGKAREAGINVIMDKCIKIEHQKINSPG